jgi:hypothetical protein
MKNRTTPLLDTNPARLWAVDLGPAGVYPFRFPSYALAARLGKFVATANAGITDGPGTVAHSMALAPIMAAVVAACWWHPERDLSTPWPVRRVDPRSPPAPVLDPSTLTDAELTAYGLAVADELQDAGWNPLVVLRVGTAALTEINQRNGIAKMAADLAGFTPPQAEGSIS